MSQQRVSRYGVTHATDNATHAEWVSQRVASRHETTTDYENSAKSERSFSSWIYQRSGHTPNSRWLYWQWEDFNMIIDPLNALLGVHNSQVPREAIIPINNWLK